MTPRTLAFLILFLFPATARLDVTGKSQMSQMSPGDDDPIAQVLACEPIRRNYPGALSSLLEEVTKQTSLKLRPEPVLLKSFDSDEIFKYPFIYVNYADRDNWNFSESEKERIKDYLARGGFIFVDAGVNAEFLRKELFFGQHHSYADWQVTPELASAFKSIYPDREFRPLKRNHEIFKSFYHGLPDPSKLPDSVRDYVVNEKWPDGTYSLLALYEGGRVAVLVSPIISMGWGKDNFGNWTTKINFRVLEGAEGLSERLRSASYAGARFEAVREDGRKDLIYCQSEATPAWVQEPDGRWRVFRYYQSTEISDYAHIFYSRLGINIFVYAFTH